MQHVHSYSHAEQAVTVHIHSIVSTHMHPRSYFHIHNSFIQSFYIQGTGGDVVRKSIADVADEVHRFAEGQGLGLHVLQPCAVPLANLDLLTHEREAQHASRGTGIIEKPRER